MHFLTGLHQLITYCFNLIRVLSIRSHGHHFVQTSSSAVLQTGPFSFGVRITLLPCWASLPSRKLCMISCGPLAGLLYSGWSTRIEWKSGIWELACKHSQHSYLVLYHSFCWQMINQWKGTLWHGFLSATYCFVFHSWIISIPQSESDISKWGHSRDEPNLSAICHEDRLCSSRGQWGPGQCLQAEELHSRRSNRGELQQVKMFILCIISHTVQYNRA